MLDWWGLRFLSVWQKKVFFHEFLWFWQFFTNLPYFFAIHRNFLWSEQIWSKALARATNLWSEHTNYGEWWKIGQIREKQSKSKKFVKKHLFCQTRRNLVPINTTGMGQIWASFEGGFFMFSEQIFFRIFQKHCSVGTKKLHKTKLIKIFFFS